MTTAPALQIAALSAGYRDRPVLRGLDIAPLAPGSVAAIIGPNGAGKSTLLRAVAGLVPAQGRVLFGPYDLLALPAGRRAAKLGFMPQTVPAGVGLNLLETVIGALKVGGWPGSMREVQLRAMTVLQRLGIAELAMEPLDRLSGGQRQLGSLAQAVARGPGLLLLDEPTSALDLRHQFAVMQVVRSLADEGRTVLLALHDLALAAQWADRVIVLKAGALSADAAPQVAITPAMLADVYGIEARVERCVRGRLQIMTDGLAMPARTAPVPATPGGSP